MAEHQRDTIQLQTKLTYLEKALHEVKGNSLRESRAIDASVLPVMRQMQSFAQPFLETIQQRAAGGVPGIPSTIVSKIHVRQWDVEQTMQFLECTVALPPAELQRFRDERVTGMDLKEMSVQDLVVEFGVKSYKARSVKRTLGLELVNNS